MKVVKVYVGKNGDGKTHVSAFTSDGNNDGHRDIDEWSTITNVLRFRGLVENEDLLLVLDEGMLDVNVLG